MSTTVTITVDIDASCVRRKDRHDEIVAAIADGRLWAHGTSTSERVR